MNNSTNDRRVALGALLIVFGAHFLLQAFPQSGYHFGILVPLAAFLMLLGVYGTVVGFQHRARETVLWSSMLGFAGIIMLLQATEIMRFGFTAFVGAALGSVGLSIVLSALLEAVEGTAQRHALLWGVVAVALGALVFLSGLDIFSLQTINIIRKSAVGGLFIVLGLAVLIKGGRQK